MKRVTFITGADRGLGFALCKEFLAKGWQVFAGQYMPQWPQLASLVKEHSEDLHIVPLDVASGKSVKEAAQEVARNTDHVDVLVNNAGIASPLNRSDIKEQQLDYEDIHRVYDVNALGPLRMVEAFLPLMDNGSLKRLCFVSSEAGSVGACKREAGYGYCMSKAALNMAVKITFNKLRGEGYTFRLYHPGWMRTYMSGQKNKEADMEPEEAAVYALAYFLSGTPYSTQQLFKDEDCLVLRDYTGREWAW